MSLQYSVFDSHAIYVVIYIETLECTGCGYGI